MKYMKIKKLLKIYIKRNVIKETFNDEKINKYEWIKSENNGWMNDNLEI